MVSIHNGLITPEKKKRVGHLFQGRFKAILVDKDNYLLELCRYVVLNPLRAKMVASAHDYPWSSYRATTGYYDTGEWLDTGWILSLFGKQKQRAREKYIGFVEDGIGQESPLDKLQAPLNQQQQADSVTLSPFVHKAAQKLPVLLRSCAGR